MIDFKLRQEVYFIVGYKVRIGNIHRLVKYIDEEHPNGRTTDIIIHEYEENGYDFKSHSLDNEMVFKNEKEAQKGLKIKKSSEFGDVLENIEYELRDVNRLSIKSVNTQIEIDLLSGCKKLYSKIIDHIKKEK